jgi:hypothetical protein
MSKRRRKIQRLIWIALSVLVIGSMVIFTAFPGG